MEKVCKEKIYEEIPGFNNKGLISKKNFLANNHFAQFSTDELKELFDQFRFFCNNGYTPKGTILDQIRKEICKESPIGVRIMQDELMFAIVADYFMKDMD